MIKLAALFADVDAALVLQEEATVQIDQNAESTVTHIRKATDELQVANDWAGKLRRHKWMCLGISVLIVIVIIIILVIAIVLAKKSAGG